MSELHRSTLPTVTLVLGSQTFQNQLATTLQKRGMLTRVHSFGAGLEIFDPESSQGLRLIRSYALYKLANRILWAAWRRLPGASVSMHLPVVFSTAVADRLASHWIPACAIYHGWTSLCLASVRVAKQKGAITLIENAVVHPREWQRAVLAECETFGVKPRDCRAILPSLLVRRMMREFEICDYIVVPSEVARRSFEVEGHARKAVVVHQGVDHRSFTPSVEPPQRNPFRACYVGRVEIAKGVPYLLQAWKQLSLPNAELVMIGEVAPEIRSILRQFALPNVRLTGVLSSEQVADWYRRSHLLVFPSVNEGLARVLLEAMAAGLPVVATELSGAEDCVTQGVDGTVVPARDSHALAEAIRAHFNDSEKTVAMGKAARIKIERNFTVDHYVERIISLYCALAGAEVGARGSYTAGAIEGSRAGTGPTPIS
jgi:glycosyltransferase involved in cell wall biosynthesis